MSAPGWRPAFRSALIRPEYRVVIEAFFDDSGKESQGDHRFVCIAGYLAHDQVWWGFQQRWRHLLMRHGIPAVHMKDWEGTRREKKWALNYGHRVLSEFIGAIKDSQLIGFGVAVDADVWRKLSSQRRKSFGDAQEFCFQRLLRRIIDRLDQAQERDAIELVFNRDYQFARPRLRLLEHINKRDPRMASRVAAISFGDARHYYLLQAADILAWQTRKHLVNQSGTQAETEGWRELFSALPDRDLDYEGELWDGEMVEAKFSELEADQKKMREMEKLRAS